MGAGRDVGSGSRLEVEGSIGVTESPHRLRGGRIRAISVSQMKGADASVSTVKVGATTSFRRLRGLLSRQRVVERRPGSGLPRLTTRRDAHPCLHVWPVGTKGSLAVVF